MSIHLNFCSCLCHFSAKSRPQVANAPLDGDGVLVIHVLTHVMY